MKLTLEQPQLAALISAPTGIVENRNTIPILGYIKLSATETDVTVTATDLDIEAVTTCAVQVERAGECTVPAKLFEGIIKRTPKSALVTLDYDGSNLNITAGRSEFKLQTLPVGDFPVLASDAYDTTSNIDAGLLMRMLNKTKFAMSNEETRYYLCGVYMHNDDAGDLVMVATDGHRLAKMTSDNDVSVSSVIIPSKTVAEFIRLLDSVDGDVTLETSETKIRLSGNGFRVVSKVIDGTFPDYTRVFPRGNSKEMSVDAKEFSSAATSVVAVSDDRSKLVKLTVDGDVCSLMGRGGVGEAKSEVTVEYSDERLEIGFNSAYLADMMSQAEGGTVTMTLGGSGDPALVTMSECAEFVGVVMPMRA